VSEHAHTCRIEEAERGKRQREVCVICDWKGPWWTVTQINGPFGRDLFVYEREDETVIRWGELKNNEARIPEWAMKELVAMRMKRAVPGLVGLVCDHA